MEQQIHHHFSEDHSRSLMKTATYRTFIVAMDFAIAYAITGNIGISLGFTTATNAVKTVGYYAHERAWDGIHWGKRAHAHPVADEEID
jgi:uncharacterized membrane protein